MNKQLLNDRDFLRRFKNEFIKRGESMIYDKDLQQFLGLTEKEMLLILKTIKSNSTQETKKTTFINSNISNPTATKSGIIKSIYVDSGNGTILGEDNFVYTFSVNEILKYTFPDNKVSVGMSVTFKVYDGRSAQNIQHVAPQKTNSTTNKSIKKNLSYDNFIGQAEENSDYYTTLNEYYNRYHDDVFLQKILNEIRTKTNKSVTVISDDLRTLRKQQKNQIKQTISTYEVSRYNASASPTEYCIQPQKEDLKIPRTKYNMELYGIDLLNYCSNDIYLLSSFKTSSLGAEFAKVMGVGNLVYLDDCIIEAHGDTYVILASINRNSVVKIKYDGENITVDSTNYSYKYLIEKAQSFLYSQAKDTVAIDYLLGFCPFSENIQKAILTEMTEFFHKLELDFDYNSWSVNWNGKELSLTETLSLMSVEGFGELKKEILNRKSN